MLSDSTPGRATLAASAALAAEPPGLFSAIVTEQGPVLDQQRLGDEPRLQRMREQRALPQSADDSETA